MARPRVPVDENLLKKLTMLHLSDKVIADCLEISVDTLHRRFADKMGKWRSESKAKLAEVFFHEAIKNREPWALKAAVQKHLDYSDRFKSEAEYFDKKSAIPVEMSAEEKIEMLDKMKQRIISEAREQENIIDVEPSED